MLQVWKMYSLCYIGWEHRELSYCSLSALSAEHRNITWCGRRVENSAMCTIGINSSCPHTHRAQDPRVTHPCAWQCDMRRNWESTSKALLSLGMGEKLCYLYSTDDTESIVMKGCLRICATPSKLLNGQALLLCCDLRGWSWLQPFLAFQKMFCVFV